MKGVIDNVAASTCVADAVARARAAQRDWGARPLAQRLAIIRRLRHAIARDPWPLVNAVPPPRAPAETLVAEILPLAEAARFLEREARHLLAPRTPAGVRPLWLLGVRARLFREPIGVILILAPSNYPIMLPGIQVLQALAAGNTVCLKPAPGFAEAAIVFARLLAASGLPAGVLEILDDSVATGARAAAAAVDRIVLTGSAATGARVLAAAAPNLIPATMELSGCDAMFVLEGADLALVADSIAYGLSLNGGATCIAPRRVFVDRAREAALNAALRDRITRIPPAIVPPAARKNLDDVLADAEEGGARVFGHRDGAAIGPILVTGASPEMRIARADLFAPVTTVFAIDDIEAALAADALCPYALGASIFGSPETARAVAARVRAGSVVINDIIVPTADPRLPFGGRGRSGFGVTRGAEGLLEMTVIKTVSERRLRFRPHLRAARAGDAARFAALIALLHTPGIPRWRTIRGLLSPLGK